MAAIRESLYETVTAKIVAMLESGVRPWQQPWENRGGTVSLPIRANGEHYRGINVFILWIESQVKGYKSSQWMTYKQAQTLGGFVRKGEKSTCVCYYGSGSKTVENADGETEKKGFRFLKTYCVFNVDQIDGLPERFYAYRTASDDRKVQEVPQGGMDAVAAAVGVVERNGISLRHGGDRACFSPSLDYVQMPNVDQFTSGQAYSATLLHECVHWTGAESRLNRTFGKRFGDEAYAVEELVAEMGAAFLCAILGVTASIREDHAAYLSHWVKVLRTDNRAIFTAAAAASAAVDRLLGETGTPEEE